MSWGTSAKYFFFANGAVCMWLNLVIVLLKLMQDLGECVALGLHLISHGAALSNHTIVSKFIYL